MVTPFLMSGCVNFRTTSLYPNGRRKAIDTWAGFKPRVSAKQASALAIAPLLPIRSFFTGTYFQMKLLSCSVTSSSPSLTPTTWTPTTRPRSSPEGHRHFQHLHLTSGTPWFTRSVTCSYCKEGLQQFKNKLLQHGLQAFLCIYSSI